MTKRVSILVANFHYLPKVANPIYPTAAALYSFISIPVIQLWATLNHLQEISSKLKNPLLFRFQCQAVEVLAAAQVLFDDGLILISNTRERKKSEPVSKQISVHFKQDRRYFMLLHYSRRFYDPMLLSKNWPVSLAMYCAWNCLCTLPHFGLHFWRKSDVGIQSVAYSKYSTY